MTDGSMRAGRGRETEAWRDRLLRGLLLLALAMLTVVVPVLVLQARLYESALGLGLAISTYAVVLAANLAPRAPYRARVFALLFALAVISLPGLVRVGYQIGPGVGSALIVVTAGLLLGQRAMWIAFTLTVAAIPLAGWLHRSNGAAFIVQGANDPLLFDNWMRSAMTYSFFTCVLASAVTFVVRRIESLLDERTAALSALQTEQAQRKQTETALDHAHGTIMQMQKLEAVGRLAGGVAHDFNNALVVVLGWADALKRMTDEQKRALALDEIVAAGSRAARLTQQLLTVGRKAVSVPAVLNPAPLLAEIGRFVERVLPESIRLCTEVAADTPAIFADAAQLHHVVLNLCLNARDAMPHGGELTIRARRHEGDGSAAGDAWTAIEVEDTGTGMTKETLDRLFEPFFTTKGELGTGLGLSTVHGIVTQAGGRVSVDSVLDKGTKFTLLLPSASAPAPAIHEIAPKEISAQASGTVLIAEDDRAVREVMVQALRDAGHEVLAAEDGRAALELARRYRGRIDLLCSDGVMPGIQTGELINGFRHLFPDAPIIVCSGHVRELSLRRQLEARDVHYLAKPFTGRAFAHAVAEVLAEQGRARHP